MSAEGHNTRLVVFSDDWGRHPSSCQHLVGQLLPRYPTLWVNTIGTRRPGLSAADLRKIFVKLRQWVSPPESKTLAGKLPVAPAANLTVVSPRMWPGFSRPWQRRFNARSISRAVNRALGPRAEAHPEARTPSPGGVDAATLSRGERGSGAERIAITTLPITADLVGELDVDRWVYYCVDDFTVWPGMDGDLMRTMERQLVAKVDAIVAVSEVLRKRLAEMGREAEVLTHGFDPEHWGWSKVKSEKLEVKGPESRVQGPESEAAQSAQSVQVGGGGDAGDLPEWWGLLARPIILFWGLIDQRLDVDWCARLAGADGMGTLVLVGAQQSPDSRLAQIWEASRSGSAGAAPSPGGKVAATLSLRRERGLVMPGPVDYARLPALAAAADVLVMPYADLPVTRAMQPLKLKEYLATGKPVVVRDLPATREWADAADVVKTAEEFVATVRMRAKEGVPPQQNAARARLADESWAKKAERFEAILLGGS